MGLRHSSWALMSGMGLEEDGESALCELPREHHGQAPATCSLLAYRLEQAPISLYELLKTAPGELAASSRARLELQVAEGTTDEVVICAFLGERFGP